MYITIMIASAIKELTLGSCYTSWRQSSRLEAVTPPGPLESSSIDGLLFISAVRKVEDFRIIISFLYLISMHENEKDIWKPKESHAWFFSL